MFYLPKYVMQNRVLRKKNATLISHIPMVEIYTIELGSRLVHTDTTTQKTTM